MRKNCTFDSSAFVNCSRIASKAILALNSALWLAALFFDAGNMGVLIRCIREQKQLSLDKIGCTYHP